MTRRTGDDGPTWYKDAIIYEVRARSFFDSNDDGIGDLRGLASRLDYLQDLGVTALWLLPFYPSPGRDDGYDISDYTDIHPDVGTLADFDHLLAEAHRRGLRVITELVLNHTSDQHPWFERARRAPPGSTERDFYVWSGTPDRYLEARIIFKDFEQSNWAFDRQANAYYWHRFYAHQPDLNFENPAVHEAMLGVVDFWLEKGVDGLRLDAVPYLYEEEGTSSENLPKTHAFLRKLRAHIDSKFANRLLLAEANQWPEDAAAYFGNGDECHMNFHFPLMPRMFMAIHMEDRFPIVDIFAQTPAVHPSCQWALFLRNHDELTLEMVTDEERDTMYRAYADRAAMRINLGIRRRLAPLVGNSRRKMELLNGLLFSLPGTPVLYYGDEIGMGDNVYLGDRNGVRTPMQWSTDRNAGFSRANPQQLVLPIVIDPEYHYESLNVENQQQNPTSLLWWTKRLIAMRKRYAAFGRGTTEFLGPANPRILAFVRQYGDETLLVVANLSRFPQYAELDLSKHRGRTPVELFGKARFPAVTEAPYMLSLGPHGIYWFSLERPAGAAEVMSTPLPSRALECQSLESLLLGEDRRLLDEALPAFLESRPWYGGRDRAVSAQRIERIFPLRSTLQGPLLALVRVEYVDTPFELYALPLTWVTGERPAASGVPLVVATWRDDGTYGALVDATLDGEAVRALLETAFRNQRVGTTDRLIGWSAEPEALATLEAEPRAEPRKMDSHPDHTTLRYGERFVLKIVHHVGDGVRPELEVSRFLSRHNVDIAPRLQGALELSRGRLPPSTVAIAHAFVPSAGTAWHLTLEELGRFFDRVLSRKGREPCPAVPLESPFVLAGRDPPAVVSEMMGAYRDTAAQLGRRVADLHRAFAAADGDPAFAPELYTALDRRSKYQSLRNLAGKMLRTLRQRLPLLQGAAHAAGSDILAREDELQRSFEPLLRARTGGMRIRTHGDLNLGHALYTGKGFVLTGFNGFEAVSVEERRRKRSPLRDLAWMAGSFELAALQRLFDPACVRESDVDAAHPWAMHWSSWTSAAFLKAYLAATAGANLLPGEPESCAVMYQAFALERALRQLQGDLEQAAETTTISLLGIVRVLAPRPA